MFDNHLNFAIGTIHTAPENAGDTAFVLEPGDAEKFLADMPVTICPPNTQPNGDNSEIGYLTAINDSIFTILREQEGSLPMQVAAGWKIIGSITAKTVTDIEEALVGKADAADLEAIDQALSTKADKTELFSKDYNDLDNKPTLGSAAATEATAYATAAQGAKADSAVQPAALGSKADLFEGVVPTSQIPALALTATQVVANETAMLALTSVQVQPGDIAVRLDGAGTFILSSDDPSLLVSWTRLNAPTDAVLSVNGQTGTVVLGKGDVGLNLADNTPDSAKPVSTAQAAADALGVQKSGDAMTGSLIVKGTVATTAFGVQTSDGTNVVQVDQFGNLVTRHVRPQVNGTYALGTTTLYFQNTYTRNIFVNPTAFLNGDSAGQLKATGIFVPTQAPTASAPAYVKGGMYFDTTLNKMRIGGSSGWETVSST